MILEVLAQYSRAEQIERLVHLVRLQPLVSGCIKRLTDIAVANGFTILERRQALCSALQDELLKPYSAFLRASVEMMYFCGFVAFTVRRIEDVPVPVVLPLGSFSWSCELPEAARAPTFSSQKPPETYQAPHVPGDPSTAAPQPRPPKRPRAGPLLEYRVRMRTSVCRDEDVVVVPWVPCLVESNAVVPSPLSGLLARFLELEKGHELLHKAVRWNAERHLVVTERVDLKDQTSSGIQLLDEFRAYRLTGQVDNYNAVRRLRMNGSGNKALKNVNDAMIHWARTEFEEGDATATVHCLPPNTDVQELQAIDLNSLGVDTQEDFRMNVLEFFNMQNVAESNKTAGASEALTRSQHDTAQNISTFLESAVVAAYAACFGLERRDVRCKVRPQSRLSIDSTDDIKKLTESNMLPGCHGEKVRTMFGLRSEVDRKGGTARGNGFLQQNDKETKEKGDKEKKDKDNKGKDKK